MTVEKAFQFLPSRARVGLALASVEHVAAALSSEPAALSGVRQGLDEGWRWVQGGQVDLMEFYARVDPVALTSADFSIGTAQKSVLLSAVSAFCYITGEIWSYTAPADLDQTSEDFGEMRSTLVDVGEDDLIECLCQATECTVDVTAEAQWQQHIAERLLADFRTDDPEQLGPPIVREYFLN